MLVGFDHNYGTLKILNVSNIEKCKKWSWYFDQ